MSLPFSDHCGPIGTPPFTPLLDDLAGRGLPVRYRQLVDTDAFRTPMASLFSQAGAGSGADSVTAIVVACSGCFFLLFIPTIAAGLAVIGAWLMGLAQPAAPRATPPPPPLPGGGL